MNKVRSIVLMLICMLALVACSGGESEPKYTQNFVEGCRHGPCSCFFHFYQ